MEEHNICEYCNKEKEEKLEYFCGKLCCRECKEKILLMDKLESNKMLSEMNSKYIKHGICKYGSVFTFIIAILVIITTNSQTALTLGYVIAIVSLTAHVIATLFRKKYKTTLELLLNEYKIQIHDFPK